MRFTRTLALTATLISLAAAQAPPDAAPPKPASSGAIQQRTPPQARITDFRAQRHPSSPVNR